jgi:hypothetical protein
MILQQLLSSVLWRLLLLLQSQPRQAWCCQLWSQDLKLCLSLNLWQQLLWKHRK